MKKSASDKIQTKLQSLNFHQALTFGYLLCKKLFPDYALFSEFENFGKPDVLYSGLVALRKHISGSNNKEEIQAIIHQLWNDDEITPDTDHFPGNISASLALNAVSALFNTLKYAELGEIDWINKVSNLSLNSVVMYFVENNHIDQNQPKDKYYKTIYSSVFVQSEIMVQDSLIEKIQAIGDKNTRSYTQIKTSESKLVENTLFSQFVYTG